MIEFLVVPVLHGAGGTSMVLRPVVLLDSIRDYTARSDEQQDSFGTVVRNSEQEFPQHREFGTRNLGWEISKALKMIEKERIIVGVTGASGSVYGWRLLEKLRAISSVELHLIVSRSGE